MLATQPTLRMVAAASAHPRALPAPLRRRSRSTKPPRSSSIDGGGGGGAPPPPSASVRLRSGTSADLEFIRSAVFQEGMNPLGLKPERFVVAVDDAAGGQLVGFG
jgi:hypothetical protein